MSLLMAFISFSSAFSPDNAPYIGIEPVLHRNLTEHRQQQLRDAAAWQAFLAAYPSWKARFDQFTERPYRAWGGGIEIDIVDDKPSLQMLEQFINNWPQVFGVKLSSLRLRDAAHTQMGKGADFEEGPRNWLIYFEQVQQLREPVWNPYSLDGAGEWIQVAPVYRSGVAFRLAQRDQAQGQLTQLGVSTHPAPESLVVSFSAEEAMDRAQRQGPAPQALHEDRSARLVVLPYGKGSTREQRLCWEIRSHTTTPVGHWVSFIDAQSGELLNVHNEVRFLEGSLHATHDTRTVDGNISESPLYRLRVDSSDSQNISDTDGSYLLTESPEEFPVVRLESSYTEIINDAGDNAQLTLSGGEQLWQQSDDEVSTATIAELDQYVFQTTVTNWALQYAPQITNQWRVKVNVNINDVCNAYFDGELNFFRAGSGCNNTGRIADVSYHEWGHGFHYFNLLSGDYDGAMSEGIADSISFFHTEDNIMAPHFSTNGNGIRNVEPNRVYPDDLVDEVHADGLIFAGAVWDLWKSERAARGDEAAYAFLIPLFVDALRAGPALDTVFDEFVFANDDNGDLSDGTPDLCPMVDAFGLHGLGPGGGSGFFQVSMDPLAGIAATLHTGADLIGSSLDLRANVEVFAEQCAEGQIDSVVLNVRDQGDLQWSSSELNLESELIAGEMLISDEGVKEYHLEWTDSTGNTGTLPEQAWINPFQIYFGHVEEIYCTDFETDDAGFTHELVAGQEQEGADDWMWGMPMGFGGDPDYAASGEYVWGNDLGGEINGSQYNGEYQNDKHNRLTTPEFDVSGYDQVVLSFDRWLNVEDGHYDQANVLANGEVVWSNHSTNQNNGVEHHRDRQWVPHTVLVETNEIMDMSFGWEIVSDRGLSMGGWTIDNVCVYGVVEPELDADDVDGPKSGCACDSADGVSSREPFLLFGIGLLALVAVRRQS